MSKSIVTVNYGHEEKQTVQEYIESKIYDDISNGVIEIAASNAEKAQKSLSVLCQILADQGVLTVEDVIKIADQWEQEYKLVDDE